jgi:chemotaxis protein CheZ
MSESKFPGDAAEVCTTMYQRIGVLTRTLHDTLSKLGLDRKLHEAASSLPDARTRLAYVSQLTGQAAERVLNAVDRAESVQRHVGELSDQVNPRPLAKRAWSLTFPKYVRRRTRPLRNCARS